MDSSSEQLHPLQPIVRIENPHQIYILLQNSKPFAIPQPESVEEIEVGEGAYVAEHLSETRLDGDFLLTESTTISLTEPEDIDGEPTYNVDSLLVIADPERNSPTHGFYDEDKLERIRSALEAQQVAVDASGLRAGILTIPGEGQEAIEINFGAHGATMRDYIDQAPKSVRPNIIHEAMRKAAKGNDQITLILQRNGEGGLAVGDEVAFKHSLDFYAQTYDKLLKALYQEKGLPLPENQVVLKSPVALDARLKFD